MSDTPRSAPSKSHGRKSITVSQTPRGLIENARRLSGAWAAQVITLFPDAFPGLLGESVTGKALKDGLWTLRTTDLRRFGEGKHRNVDDTPAGGGPGMVLRADVMGHAIEAATKDAPENCPILFLSPRGAPFTQATARKLAEGPGVTLICGRFEGMDERVIEHFKIKEVSMGDFVLTGGEIAAQALIDATIRLRPGVLGNPASADEESFSSGLLEHPQYTRPTQWNGRTIPDVLMSGNHAKIAEWRKAQSETLTRARRPDLWSEWNRSRESDD